MKLSRMVSSLAAGLLMGTALVCSSGVEARTLTLGGSTDSSTNLSVFAAVDTKSDETGLGAALGMKSGNKVTELAYVDLDDKSIAQASILGTKSLAGYSVYLGMCVAYANLKDDAEGADGLMGGFEAVLNVGQWSSGLSLDLRGSVLGEDLNPVEWITDPDIFWIGGGISYTF